MIRLGLEQQLAILGSMKSEYRLAVFHIAPCPPLYVYEAKEITRSARCYIHGGEVVIFRINSNWEMATIKERSGSGQHGNPHYYFWNTERIIQKSDVEKPFFDIIGTVSSVSKAISVCLSLNKREKTEDEIVEARLLIR